MDPCLKRPISPTDIVFTGPAHHGFNNFWDLASFSLDTNCSHWRDYVDPENYLIPPLFYYKRADKSDHEFGSAKAKLAALDLDPGAKSKANPEEFCLVKDRGSDEAEHIVYQAIEQLIQEGIQAPFVAIHNFNMNRVGPFLHDLFPPVRAAGHDDICCPFREYDFVLIGPKIGIIVIEVKSSSFTQRKDFVKGHSFLPADYSKGLHQLDSFDSIVSLLKQCTEADIRTDTVRKVLFTPNLQKRRFFEWYNNLAPTSKEAVCKRMKNAVCWFTEDMESPRTRTSIPSIYRKFRHLIQSSSTFQMSESVYEIYCPLFVGLASVSLLSSEHLGLAPCTLSEGEALLIESCRIQTHDPTGKLTVTYSAQVPKRLKKDSGTVPEIIKVDKAIILTPEQKAALEGPNRQFIVGPAGVGKTIILQAKALELLKHGKSVFVFCPPWFAPKYKELFEQCGYRSFDIQSSWIGLVERPVRSSVTGAARKFGASTDAYEFVKNVLNDSILFEQLKNSKILKVLLNYDGLFFDDMMDLYGWDKGDDAERPECESELTNRIADVIFSLQLFALAKTLSPSNTIWIAFDFWNDQEHYFYRKDYMEKENLIKHLLNLDSIFSPADNYYALTKLNRVMRCPENVFRAAYDFGGKYGPAVRPHLGHKIQGKNNKIKIPCKSRSEGLQIVWEKIEKILYQLSVNNISFNNACLILGFGWITLEEGTRAGSAYFFKKCEENDIPACTMPSHLPPIFEYTTSVRKSSTDKGILTICGPTEVSSAEWAMVIYVDYRDLCRHHLYSTSYRYDYRARSRATGELIEITAVRALDIPKRQRSLSDSFGTHASYEKTRSGFEKSDLTQLRNTAGSVALLARVATWVRLLYPQRWFLKEYRQELRNRTRRRHYSVSEIDFSEKRTLRQGELKNLKEFGREDLTGSSSVAFMSMAALQLTSLVRSL